jgi:hypothetical protein
MAKTLEEFQAAMAKRTYLVALSSNPQEPRYLLKEDKHGNLSRQRSVVQVHLGIPIPRGQARPPDL